jgi:HD-GYP domain-containing protein (c-di-GMP phosphodiesterase class II)
MNRFKVDKLKTGMRFSKPVYIDSNNMLVGANVSIREGDIKRLIRWGIKEILTEGTPVDTTDHIVSLSQSADEALSGIFNDYNKLIKMREEVDRVHQEACSAVQKAHQAVRNNRLIVVADLDRAVEAIINLISNNKNVFIFNYKDAGDGDPLAIHSVNTTFYAVLIGMSMKYSKPRLVDLAMGTMMINVGMALIPTYITHKQSPLSDHEINQVKTHPILAYQAMKKLGNFSEKCCTVVIQHHEQFDGKGYPRGITGADIDEGARIASIAENYEAFLETRSYREKQFFYQAMKQLAGQAVSKFDPVIIRLFVSVMSVYPVGSIVELNKGGTGIVIGSNPQKPMRPIVKMVLSESGHHVRDLLIINLANEPAVFITKSLDEKESGITMLDVL